MKAYQLEEFGGFDGIRPVNRADPRPGPQQMVVRIGAASLNYRDILILRKACPLPATQGVVPLSDGAGEVVAVGEGVRRVSRGDRVAAKYFPRWQGGDLTPDSGMEQFGCTRDGMLADHVLTEETALVKIPDHLSFAEAAALPCAGVTAWSALNGPRRIIPGETVLTIGSGGVALFATQFAKAFGARTIAVTSSAEKVARLRKLGVDEVIDRRSCPEWDRAIVDLTGGRGVDHVVETGTLETVHKSLAVCGWNAQITLVLAMGEGAINTAALRGLITLRCVFIGSRSGFEAMNRAIAHHRIHPVIDRNFAFDDALSAYEYFEARTHFG